MILVEIQESSPRFQNFVAEESNEERKVNLDLLDEVREEARIKTESLEEKGGVQVQLQAETLTVPGCRPGDAKSPPILVRKQVVSQMDWSLPCDRDPWEWSIQARDFRRWSNPSYMERDQP